MKAQSYGHTEVQGSWLENYLLILRPAPGSLCELARQASSSAELDLLTLYEMLGRGRLWSPFSMRRSEPNCRVSTGCPQS